MAGGFKDFAKTKDDHHPAAGTQRHHPIKFNYKDAIKRDGKPIYVQPGDVIIVP